MNVYDLSPQAQTCLLASYHPSRIRLGISVTDRNQPFVGEAIQAGFLEIDLNRAFLTRDGVEATQRLLDEDPEALKFYLNINKKGRN